jgi:ketosteroid isomerase-like protein
LRSVTAAPEIPAAEMAIHTCLDRWHSAAARTDQETYWSLWHEDGVLLPPGSVERWTVAEFRKRAAASFERPPGWTFVPVQRWIRISDDGKSAWAEESLGCFAHGEGRGIGLLTRRDDGWRILRYAVTGFPEGAITDGKR